MKKLIPIFLIFLCSCGQESRLTDDFYEVVNNYFSDSLKNVDIVFLETTPICRGPIMDDPPIHLDLINLKYYYKMKLIDSLDINFILSQLDSTTYLMNPEKLRFKSVSSEVTTRLVRAKPNSDLYSILRENYNANSYARISTPLISKDKKKMIFYIEIYRGYLNGNGRELIFHKINGKWRIIREGGTWKS